MNFPISSGISSSLAGAGRPSARQVSNEIFAQDGDAGNSFGHNDLLWLWGQFLDHDLSLTEASKDPAATAPISVPTGDAFFDPTGTGNVTDTHVPWRTIQGAAYVTSPVVSDELLLVVSDGGIASCFDAKSGERYWRERLAGAQSSSPVVADGVVYCISDRGEATLFRLEDSFEVIAKNDLGEAVSASPAISQGQLFIRTHEALYCIGKK